jgi:hypothetical protein
MRIRTIIHNECSPGGGLVEIEADAAVRFVGCDLATVEMVDIKLELNL